MVCDSKFYNPLPFTDLSRKPAKNRVIFSKKMYLKRVSTSPNQVLFSNANLGIFW